VIDPAPAPGTAPSRRRHLREIPSSWKIEIGRGRSCWRPSIHALPDFHTTALHLDLCVAEEEGDPEFLAGVREPQWRAWREGNPDFNMGRRPPAKTASHTVASRSRRCGQHVLDSSLPSPQQVWSGHIQLEARWLFQKHSSIRLLLRYVSGSSVGNWSRILNRK
jgi:hypothetical protein